MIWVELVMIAIALTSEWLVRRKYAARQPIPKAAAMLLRVLCALPPVMAVTGKLLTGNPTSFHRANMWIQTVFLTVVPAMTIIFASLLVSRRRAVHIAGAAVSALFAVVMIYGVAWGRKALMVNRVEIYSERLPESFDGFRIAIFSDLHLGAMPNPTAETERVVQTINSLDADMAVFCGDLVNICHTELDSACMAVLSRISTRCGVCSVAGNHDLGLHIVDTLTLPRAVSRRMLSEKVRAMGWRQLDGKSIHICRGGDSISVTGLPFDESLDEIRHSRNIPPLDIARAYDGVGCQTYNITLVHMPQIWTQVTALGRGDLTLSGHVHSMQMKFRLFGRAFSPARILYRRWSGLYGDDGRYLYINDGIGSVGIPARIGAPPEITLITLRK